MKSLIQLAVLMILVQLPALAQVSFNLTIPSEMPAQLSVWEKNPSLIQLHLSVDSVYNDVGFSFLIEDASGREIARTNDTHSGLPRFTLSPGIQTLNGPQIVNLDALTVNPTFRTGVTTTNMLPEGDYQFCIRVIDRFAKVLAEFGTACRYFSVLIPDPPILVSPADSDTLPPQVLPMFVWTPVFVSAGVQALYKLTITPIQVGQTARDAIERNEPLLQRILTSTKYQYEASDPLFSSYQTATAFGWQAQAISELGIPATRNEGKSEISRFESPYLIVKRQDGDREECIEKDNWKFIAMDVSVVPRGDFRKRPCDPIAFKVDVKDRHILSYECECGGVPNIKNVPMLANVWYNWEIKSGRGEFVRLANTRGSRFEVLEQVLYQPPELQPAAEENVDIELKISHNDFTKQPWHEPVICPITIHIKCDRKNEVKTVGDMTIEKEIDEYVYKIDVSDCNSGEASPPDERAQMYCIPSDHWDQASRIEGSVIRPEGTVYTGDYVVLRSSAHDEDQLEIACLTFPQSRCSSFLKKLSLPDVLKWEWSCDKGDFPVGNIGREVVWHSPDDEGPVTINLKVIDIGGQYDDEDLELRLSLDVVKIERKAQIAAIAWINPNDPKIANLPTPIELPPLPNPGPNTPWEAPDYLLNHYYSYELPPAAVSRGIKEWQQKRLVQGNQLERLGPFHPWWHACYGLKASGNPEPPPSFKDIGELKAWMDGREYRSVLALKIKSIARRGKFISFDLEDFVIDPGWTPMKRSLPPKLLQFFAKNIPDEVKHILDDSRNGPDYHRGQRKQAAISISALCSNKITVKAVQVFRVGEKVNEIGQKLTNRDTPWITGEIEISLSADREAHQQDFKHKADPTFPTWNHYFGKTDLIMFRSNPPGERQIGFMNRGAKIRKNGV